MSNFSFALFTDKNFVDCTLFQYGWEKCDPHHSFGPAARNHSSVSLYHFRKGALRLYRQQQKGYGIPSSRRSGLLNLARPDQYVHCRSLDPWEYAWVEFDGLKAPEIIALSGLSFDLPVYNSNNPAMEQVLKDEMIYIAGHTTESSFHLIGHLYLALDALIKSSNRRMTAVGGQLKDFYAREYGSLCGTQLPERYHGGGYCRLLQLKPQLFRQDL